MLNNNAITMVSFCLFSTVALYACGHELPPVMDGGEVGDGDGDIEGDGDGDSETGTGDGDGDMLPEPDMGTGDGDGDGDPDPGWCCECGTDPLSCTPSSTDECTAEGFEWCLLDAEGNPSDCEAACEVVEPETYCCECGVYIGAMLSCEPMAAEDCTAEGFESCELDENNYPAACEAACEQPPELNCCICDGVWCPCDVPQAEWCPEVTEGHPQECIDACEGN